MLNSLEDEESLKPKAFLANQGLMFACARLQATTVNVRVLVSTLKIQSNCQNDFKAFLSFLKLLHLMYSRHAV